MLGIQIPIHNLFPFFTISVKLIIILTDIINIQSFIFI